MAHKQGPYQELGDRQIRTLRLSAIDGEQLHASFQIEDLDTADFVAISYVWGDESNKKQIWLENEPWLITKNAYDVLARFALPIKIGAPPLPKIFQNCRIWLDAICINQSDPREKLFQIGTMQDIYAKARRTLIQLGAPNSSSEARLALDFLRQVVDYGPVESFKRGFDSASEVVDALWDDHCWEVFCNMVMQPWHHRRWIVQEAVLSREPWILYGNQQMLWTEFVEGVERCGYLFSSKVMTLGSGSDLRPRYIDITPILSMTGLRVRSIDHGRAPQLLHLLHCFRRNNCKEPKDRLTALLGLCSSEERQSNMPSESSTLRDVLMNYAVQHIRIHRDLNILCLATDASRILPRREAYWMGDVQVLPLTEGMPTPIIDAALPSWCPNITSHHAFWTFGHDAVAFREYADPYFTASQDLAAEIQDLGQSLRTRVLVTAGLEVDEIVEVEPQTPIIEEQVRQPHCNQYRSIYDLARRRCLGSFASEVEMLTSFLRTITAGGRRSDTRDFVSDRYLRHYFIHFFGNVELGQEFRRIRDEPLPDAQNIYLDPHAHKKYGVKETPSLGTEKLSFTRFACTKKGRMILASPYVKKGDRICVLFGCSSPILLTPLGRYHNDVPLYKNRSEVFIDGYMHGEGIDAWRHGRLQEGLFAIR